MRRFFDLKLLDGVNPGIDRVFFRLFNEVNDFGKSLAGKKTRDLVYNRLLKYLLQVAPGYDSAQPLLGSKEEEQLLLEYKKMRFLEAAKPCDVILVRGNLRISHVIQTLTKSPYSHAAFYLGDGKIIEAEPQGVIVRDIDKYLELDIRICRPVMLSRQGKKTVIQHMEEMVRLQPRYDVVNIEKLLFKYWYTKFRPDIKVYIGGNTIFEHYYICSGMIAHGFHKAGYPVSPSLRLRKKKKIKSLKTVGDFEKMVQLLKKNYSQIVPADFDNSPFFASVKFLYLDCKHNAKKRFQLEQEEESLGEGHSTSQVIS
ncbi:hypothetical protein KKI24_02985 [bacterium]|nr:hypothetical protein [bacterium]